MKFWTYLLYISSSERNSSAGERRTHWATSWRGKIKGEEGGQRIIHTTESVHCIPLWQCLGFFPHRWSSTYAWYVGVEVMKIDYCFVMGVTTAITPSVWSHPSTMSLKVTGGAPSAWLRWATSRLSTSAKWCHHDHFLCLYHIIVLWPNVILMKPLIT